MNKEYSLPRGIGDPINPGPGYVGRPETVIQPDIPQIELLEGESPFGPPKEYSELHLSPEKSRKLLEAGIHYDSANERHVKRIIQHIEKRFELDPDRSKAIVSGTGSLGIIRHSLSLLPNPPLSSHLFVVGPSFPNTIDSAITKLNKPQERRLTEEEIAPHTPLHEMIEEGSIDGKSLFMTDLAKGVSSIFMPLGTKTEHTLEKVMERRSAMHFRKAIMYYICNPNTPQGDVIPIEKIREAARFFAGKGDIFFVDEAYGDYVDDSESAMNLTNELPNMIVTRTLSKGMALAGWRIGYAALSKELGEKYLGRIKYDPFYISGPQQQIAEQMLDPNVVKSHLEDTVENGIVVREGLRSKTRRIKQKLMDALTEADIYFLPTDARTPIMTIMGDSQNFYDNLKSLGIICAPGQGFKPTHDDLDNSFVRALIPKDENLIPDIVGRISTASKMP